MAEERRTFSHSRLGTLADCPRRYQFRYIQRLKEAFQSIEAFMGTMVHEALQWAYIEREAKREPPVDAVLERYHDTWRARIGPGVKVVQEGREPGQWLDEGAEMLRRHLRTVFAEDRLETLAIEPPVDIDLAGIGYTGFIDRLARDAQGILHVIDYKTSKSMPRSMEDAGLQVRGYGVAVLEEHGGVEVGLRYEYLRHGRALTEMFPRSRCGEVTAALTERIDAALEAERVGEFPARPGPLCRWCGFRETCDASPFRALTGAPSPEAAAAEAPSSRPSPTTEPCPRCGSALKRRSGSRGNLLACSRYPDCGHAVALP